jgi:hypothetical protein
MLFPSCSAIDVARAMKKSTFTAHFKHQRGILSSSSWQKKASCFYPAIFQFDAMQSRLLTHVCDENFLSQFFFQYVIKI